MKLRFAHRIVTFASLALVTGLSNAWSQTGPIPAQRLVDWTPGVSVGVPGGIPTNRTRIIDVTQSPYNADATGATDASARVQSAVNNAQTGDVVYLPPGTYRFDNSVTPTKNNITIRGAGRMTKIDSRGAGVFYAGSGTEYAWAQPQYAEPKVNNNITGGLTKGSTAITLPSTADFSVGQMIQIALDNQNDNAAIAAGATPVVSTLGFATLRRQMTRIVGKTSTTLTIFPALHFTPDGNLTARVNHIRQQIEGFGLEDLDIDCTNGSPFAAVYYSQAYGSWVKNVQIKNLTNYGIYFSDSLNCEIRKCTIAERKSGGSNGAGLLLGHAGNCLFEDNIIYHVFPPIEVNFSSTGNVFAYNFLYNAVGGNLNMNHAPHNSFNLYEGNITPNIQPDGYFGGVSDDTLFRNWITGSLFETNTYTSIIGMNRLTRNYSLVGNILGSAGWPYGSNPYSFGNPYMGNSSYVGTAQPSSGTFWSGWRATAELTTRTSDSTGTITVSEGRINGDASYPHQLLLRLQSNETTAIAVYATAQSGNVITFRDSDMLPAVGTKFIVWWGAVGYAELDLDVEKTTIRKANYLAWQAGGMSIPASEVIPQETLPSSLFRSSKPAWFGNLAWPPFNPFSPNLAYDSIPAGYRFMHNGAEPGVGANTAPSNVRIYRR